ncbi:hypothetical protein A6A08_19585 [Nocardiopsis sp. TSRI0078]|uniref:hypothetical protein n=1 Tax=unclassified Nocardiopsis TaxID=2649073 RepID=UPI0009399846|nr:hypothetical protein [Nocardiopsis sp. TSRI0078]OKI22536.1 hypothetical protein A6A08_19585 [Nocardiopsis sp. TSRI0078]
MNQQPAPSEPRSTDPFSDIPWSLVLGLGALALLRPLLSITGLTEALDWSPFLQLGTTVLITVAWVAAVVVARAPRPLLTLVYTGLAYAVFSTVLSAVLSPIMLGELRGPVTNPFGLVAVLAVNALWGLAAGAVALAVRSALGSRQSGN